MTASTQPSPTQLVPRVHEYKALLLLALALATVGLGVGIAAWREHRLVLSRPDEIRSLDTPASTQARPRDRYTLVRSGGTEVRIRERAGEGFSATPYVSPEDEILRVNVARAVKDPAYAASLGLTSLQVRSLAGLDLATPASIEWNRREWIQDSFRRYQSATRPAATRPAATPPSTASAVPSDPAAAARALFTAVAASDNERPPLSSRLARLRRVVTAAQLDALQKPLPSVPTTSTQPASRPAR